MKCLLACLAPFAVMAQAPFSLADLERIALERNPAVAQGRAAIEVAAARAKQAGLYPNPVVSAVGDEIAAGPIIRGGELGVGVQQRIVTAGKLALSRRAAEQERLIAEESAKIERQRLLNTVRRLYYQALADQYRIEVRTNLAALAQEAVRISRELVNVGQADQPDQIAADVEAQKMQLDLAETLERRLSTWRQLAAMLNQPSLTPAPLTGDLEALPRLEIDQAVEAVYYGNPKLNAASIEVKRSELALSRAQKEVIPDVIVSGGVRYNNELLELSAGALRRPVGVEGFFDIGVELPLFNRNQGNIAAARASVENAKLEAERTKLLLRLRVAEVYSEYQTALTRADRYKQEIIPKAQNAYELYLSSFHQMAAAYPQALIAQRNLFQLQDEYATALVTVWERALEIQGQLAGGTMER